MQSLGEVQIDAEVTNLLLQLLKALFEVVVLVSLSEYNLHKGFLSLQLDRCEQCFDVLYCLRFVCIFFIKKNLKLDKRKKILLSADRKHYRDALLVLDLHLLAQVGVLGGLGLVATKLLGIFAGAELDVEPVWHLQKLVLLGRKVGKHLRLSQWLTREHTLIKHCLERHDLSSIHQV